MPKQHRYSKESVDKALEDIQAKNLSVRAAARKYEIPRATLQFKLKNPTAKSDFGPDPILKREEEDDIVKWLIEMSRKGFPKKKDDVINTVQKYLTTNPKPNPFPDNRPGRGWMRAFLKRHPAITQRTSEGVSRASACVTEADIRKWFSEIRNYLTDEDLLNVIEDPSRVFNADETGFLTCPATGRVLAPKGDKNVYSVDQGNSKESVTVLFTFSADGKHCPPLIVFPYKRLPEKLSASVPKEWGIGRSDSGWMTADVFSEFISELFSPYLDLHNIQRPVILFIDGHKSHITLQLSVLCKEHGIELIALYPNTTRITQPADVAVFGPVKKLWTKAVRNFQSQNIGEIVTKQVFALVLKNVIDAINPNHLQEGFRACGLYPFNDNAIDYSKCLAKTIINNNEESIDKTMKYEDFCEIVGQENINKFERFKHGSGVSGSQDINDTLYNLWDYFKRIETGAQTTTTSNDSQSNLIQLQQTEYAKTNLQYSIKDGETEVKITITPVKELEVPPPPDMTSSNLEKINVLKKKSNSIKQYLDGAPENKRKFVKKNVEKVPFVITSEKFKNIMETKQLIDRKKLKKLRERRDERNWL